MKLSTLATLRFYIELLFYKLITPLECRNYRLKTFVNEFTFIFAMLGLRKLNFENDRKITVRSIFGNFRIRDMDSDIAIASPSYERQDMNELLFRIRNSLLTTKNVVFVDAGACFGKYSIAVASYFRKYSDRLVVYAFEPDPENYRLLIANVKLNHLTNVKTYRVALSNSVGTKKFYYYTPMKQIVSTPTDRIIYVYTDTLNNHASDVEDAGTLSLFIKLDVEEHEIQVLKGSKKFFRRFAETSLLIEDSADSTSLELNTYLTSHGIRLVKKTPYNSFWKIMKIF